MNLKDLQMSVIKRPGIYFGSIGSRGLRELIFGPLMDFFKNNDELQINLHISILKEGLLVRIIDNCNLLNKVFKNPDLSDTDTLIFLTSFVPIKHAVLYHDNNEIFKFRSLEQLEAFKDESETINAAEYLIDYSFFNIIELNNLYFELKGKAQFFAAIYYKCKVILEDKSLPIYSEIFYPAGLSDYIREIDPDRTYEYHGEIFSLSYSNNIGKFDLSLRPCYTGPKKVISFANGQNTIEGGSHVIGLKYALNRFLKRTMKTSTNHEKNFYLPYFKSYTAVISIFLDRCYCEYKGSVKEYLLSEEAYNLVVEGINKNTDIWKEQLQGMFPT